MSDAVLPERVNAGVVDGEFVETPLAVSPVWHILIVLGGQLMLLAFGAWLVVR